jgi:hypothetical protein
MTPRAVALLGGLSLTSSCYEIERLVRSQFSALLEGR